MMAGLRRRGRRARTADPLEPMFSQPYQIHLLDWGAASPDCVYRRAMLRDDRTYRVYGRFGNARLLLVGRPPELAACTITPRRDRADADGTFEFFLGGPDPRAELVAAAPGHGGLIVREFFDDWRGAAAVTPADRVPRRRDGAAPGAPRQPRGGGVRRDRRLDPRRARSAIWIEQSTALAETPERFGRRCTASAPSCRSSTAGGGTSAPTTRSSSSCPIPRVVLGPAAGDRRSGTRSTTRTG